MAEAGARAAGDLARLAVEETGIGRVHYKILKNLFGAEGTWASIRDEKTVGILSRDERTGVVEVATPAGVVAGIDPDHQPDLDGALQGADLGQGPERDRDQPAPARAALHRRDGRGPAARDRARRRAARPRAVPHEPDDRVDRAP